MLAFHLGEAEAEYVRVAIVRDNGDDWLSAEVEASAGAFRSQFPACFNSWAFSDFLSHLEEMYRTVSGTAKFTSYEKQLELMVTCNGSGHIQVNGEAVDYAGMGNRLLFRLEIDQTYLPAILRDLRQAVQQFPRRVV